MTTSKVARVFFTIKNNVLVPLRGQNGWLDNFYNNNVDVDFTKKYNKYTKNFINSHKKESGIYYSVRYEFDANSGLFNFTKLVSAKDDDLKHVYECEFDETKDVCNDDDTNAMSFVDKVVNKYVCPTIENDGYYVNPFNWKFLCRNIEKRKNTLIIGETGTGKTELIILAAKKMGLECNVYDMGAMQDPLTDLLGSHRLNNGSSEFDYAKFVEDIQKPGIIVLDELSRAPLMSMNILFPCLDGRRELRVDIAGSKDKRVIKVHKDCVFFAIANIGDKYSGTNEIDAALMNRFLPLRLTYLPKDIEKGVLIKRTGINENACEKLLNMVAEVRNKFKRTEIAFNISTRETLAMAELVADGFEIEEAWNLIAVQKTTNEDEIETLMGISMVF